MRPYQCIRKGKVRNAIPREMIQDIIIANPGLQAKEIATKAGISYEAAMQALRRMRSKGMADRGWFIHAKLSNNQEEKDGRNNSHYH